MRSRFIFLVALVVLCITCKEKLPDGMLARQEINASQGGRVETSDGKLVLDIPANALSGNTTVTISEAQDSMPPAFRDFVGPLSRCYDIDIGTATLTDSVTLRVVCDSMPSAAKSLCYYDDSIPGWVFTGADEDGAAGALTVRTAHLSDWRAAYVVEPPITYKRLATPYYNQYDCGWCQVASMAMMMKNQGVDYEVHEVARDFGFAPMPQFPWGISIYMYLFTVDGVYRNVLGYTTERMSLVFGGNSLLKDVVGNLIARDWPCLNTSSWAGHACVITGWSADSVYFSDPSNHYGYGRLGAATWEQFMGKVGYTSNVIEAFSRPSAPENLRAGTVQFGNVWFGMDLGLSFDGRYPRGYYYQDYTGQFPDDPNEDGNDLQNMPTTSGSLTNFSCRIANPTTERRNYRFRASLFSRTTSQFVTDFRDSIIAVDPYSEVNLALYDGLDQYSLDQLQPGRYAFRLYLESDGALLDTADLCFNLADGGGGGNNPPNTPATPTGPSSGQVGTSYDFTSSATDPDGDNVAIRFDWGDGDTSDWSSYVSSGSPVTISYAWNSPSTFDVKAQAKDLDGSTSQWSVALSVSISAGTPHTVTIQPGPSDGKDSYVESGYPDDNFGSDSILTAFSVMADPDNIYINTLIQFPLSSIPQGASIDSANLAVFGSLGAYQNSMTLWDVTSAWQENTVTYNSAPSSGDYYAFSRESGTNRWFTFDVTGLVAGWVSGANANYGIYIYCPFGCMAQLKSSEHESANLRPKLTVYYRSR